jgi:hypothetical protein
MLIKLCLKHMQRLQNVHPAVLAAVYQEGNHAAPTANHVPGWWL